jgi:carboxyl-terminal processing protease
MRVRTFFLWISPLLLASVFLSMLTVRALGARADQAYWNDAIAERIRLLVGREFVDEIDEAKGKELFFAAMEGYLKALDPYCTFYDPAEREAMEEDTSGQFGGIGIQIDTQAGGPGLLINGIREGDPADVAGAKLGDRIVAVGGEEVADLEILDITAKIRGVPGTDVLIGILRGEERLDLTMKRAEIKVDSVVGVRIVDEEHGIGYLRIVSFQENTGIDTRDALKLLLEKGARSFVLDLRQNTGGVLEKGAVAMVDLFLKKGAIVRTSGRSPGSHRVYEAKAETTVAPEQPLFVLVDGGSASAAEVVAGAFQDHRRAILLGQHHDRPLLHPLRPLAAAPG